MHESRPVEFSRESSHRRNKYTRIWSKVEVLTIEGVDQPIESGLGSGSEAHVFDWTHPKGNKTVLVVGIDALHAFAGYCVYELDGGEWLRHEQGGTQGEAFQEFVEDDEFSVESFESHLAEALA